MIVDIKLGFSFFLLILLFFLLFLTLAVRSLQFLLFWSLENPFLIIDGSINLIISEDRDHSDRSKIFFNLLDFIAWSWVNSLELFSFWVISTWVTVKENISSLDLLIIKEISDQLNKDIRVVV